MKRLLATFLLAGMFVFTSGVVRAEDGREPEYEDSMMHPLHLAAYVLHPVGYAVEWLIGRPFHYIISRPQLDRVFGYQSQDDKGRFRRYGDDI